jgi:hypothetical protein
MDEMFITDRLATFAAASSDPLATHVFALAGGKNMQAEVDITDTIVVRTGGEVGSQDAGRRTLETTPAKAGERDVEMSEASVLAEAPGAITKETERTTTAEGVARTRGRPKKTPAAPQVAIQFIAGGPGENTRKRRSTEVLSEDQARPDVQEQIAQLKELILTLI